MIQATFRRKFTERVYQLADKQGISINEVARRAGVSDSYLRRILAKHHSPTLEVCAAIAKAFEMNLKEFFDYEY